MLDPDALTPANPNERSILHWLVVNIDGDNIKSGTTVAQYLSPSPTPFQGPHRYTFLIYRQSRPVVPTQFYVTEMERANFQVTPYAEANGLTGPIAGNFFYEAIPGYYSSKG
ncbi:protein D1-like [Panonychus citri]|uniref:protein D1-like n=1 Tax=Panonychus citri TaxID=50023 RepID=UPI0023077870|nr:protein D1-like [Panonychus citri]